MNVYELENYGAKRVGLFMTVEAAQRRAQQILDSYTEMYATFTEAELEESEPLDTHTLVWEKQQHYLDESHQIPYSEGPILTAHYSGRGFFTIREQVVHE